MVASRQSLILTIPLLSFLHSYRLSLSSLPSKALSIVFNFLVLRSICLSFSLVLFTKGLKFLARWTGQRFISGYYYYYYFTPLRVFHTNVSWWFFTGVWVTASFLKSLGLFSVFWPILIMLESWWFLLVFLYPSLPVLLSILTGIVLSATTIICINVTLMFHSFFFSKV